MNRLAYPLVLALAVVDAAGYSLIAPVLPEIASRTGSGPAATSLLFGTFPAAMMLGFVPAGWAIRRGQLRAVLVGSILCSAVGAVGFVLGGSYAVFVPARALMGLGSGGLWMALIMLTLTRWPDDAYARTARVLAAYSAGGLIGPALGALGGVARPFLGYLALLLASAVMALTLRIPGLPAAVARSGTWRLPGFWLSSACITFAVVAGGLSEGVLPLHLASRLSQGAIGAVFVGMAIVGSVSAAVAGSFRPRRLLPVCVVLVVGGIGLASGTAQVSWWLAGLSLAAAGGGVAGTAAMGLLIEAVPRARLVTGLVVWSQFSILGYLLGPAIGGPVAEHAGFGALVVVPLLAALPIALLTARTRRASAVSRPAPPPAGSDRTRVPRR